MSAPLEHSKRGPSTAHRWRACPGSVRLTAGMKDQAGIDAAQGTVFHEVASRCVEFGLDPQSFVGMTQIVPPHGPVEFDQAMADNMGHGLTLLRSFENSSTTLLVERRVSLAKWVGPGEFGTTDVAIIDPTARRMLVWDWKYGAGVPVRPEWNDQAILYALGTWTDIAEAILGNPADVMVTVMIEQPRAPGGGGSWEVDLPTLLAEGHRIREDADRALLPDAPLVPGEKQCRFCAAAKANTCPARTKMILDLVGLDFDALEGAFLVDAEPEVPSVSLISPEARTQILLHRGMIEEFLEQLHRDAYKDAEMGRPVPGLKLVPGRRPKRAWSDAVKVGSLLKEKLGERAFAEPALRSPAQIEEIVGRKQFGDLYKNFVAEGRARPVLVPESDPRESLPDILSDLPDVQPETPETLV